MRRVHRMGFTLIELLVVVAIIALLISILLPSLAAAKEQARISKCLANNRSINVAGTTYAGEYEDFPWICLSENQSPGNGNGAFNWFSEVVWGGNMPNKTTAEWNTAFVGTSNANITNCGDLDVYRVPPKNRPMNRFITQDVTWNAPSTGGSPRPIPAEQNEIFLCPSDNHAIIPTVGELNPVPEQDQLRTFDWWGNSYAINWYWPYYYTKAPPGNQAPYTGIPGGANARFLYFLGLDRRYKGLGRTLLNNKDGRFASEFLVFYENSLNYALEAARPPGYTGGPWASGSKNVVGWHGKLDYHAGTMLDGSARYFKADTRFVFGPSWTIWPNKPWKGNWSNYNDNPPTMP